MEPENLSFCIFEYVYFARESSIFEGKHFAIPSVLQMCRKKVCTVRILLLFGDVLSKTSKNSTKLFLKHMENEICGLTIFSLMTA